MSFAIARIEHGPGVGSFIIFPELAHNEGGRDSPFVFNHKLVPRLQFGDVIKHRRHALAPAEMAGNHRIANCPGPWPELIPGDIIRSFGDVHRPIRGQPQALNICIDMNCGDFETDR